MTFPGGLLDQSAIQRLMASMQGGTQNAVQAPNLGGLMAPQIQPTPGFNPNVDSRGRHDHAKGVRGSILHAVGADKVAPELASLLTPDQQARVQPGLMATIGNAVIRGKTPAQVQQERALNMLGLEDTKKARVKRDRDEKMWEQIQEVAAQIPDPQARLEYTARMASSMGLAQGDPASLAAQRLEPPVRAPIQETFSAPRPMKIGGKEVMVQMGSLGTQRIVPDAEPIDQRPTPDEPQIVRGVIGADGKPVIQGRDRNGNVVWEAPEDASDGALRAQQAAYAKRQDGLRMVQDDLGGVNEALAQVETNPSAFGLKNVLPTSIRQRLPFRDNEQDATTLGSLEYVVGRLRHDRFGGALSALEASKAARIFSEPSSPPEVVRAQLEVIRQALMRQQRSLSRQVEGQAAPAPSAGKTFTDPVTGKTYRIP